MAEPLVVRPSSAVVEKRAWAALGLNVVVCVGIVVLGAVLVLDGTTRSLVGGGLLVALGALLAGRSIRPLAVLVRVRRAQAEPSPPRLVLDDDAVTVFNHDAGSRRSAHPAVLAWDDCVALVASPLAGSPARGLRYYYLHFMPRPGVDVGAGVPADRLALRSNLIGQPVEAVATSWVLQSPDLDLARAVLGDVRRRRPALRVVDSIDRTGASPETYEREAE
ncbi:hypothetical protein [Nocardioides marinquilinus]|uniref:hypothetical protein n=1 Tax=Nocardioides marinquilinus TaxID=1210400 RepID=UPI0031EA7A01